MRVSVYLVFTPFPFTGDYFIGDNKNEVILQDITKMNGHELKWGGFAHNNQFACF